MRILLSHKNVKIWGLPLRFDIVHYLFPMWHVCSNKFQFSFVVVFRILFGWVCLVWFFSNMHFHTLVEKHLFHIILTMALPVGLNSWNYQQTFLNMVCLFLTSCHMRFVVKLVLIIIPIYHREISLYTPCPWQVILVIVVDFVDHFHIGSCIESSYLLPSVFILTPVVFFASCLDPIFIW